MQLNAVFGFLAIFVIAEPIGYLVVAGSMTRVARERGTSHHLYLAMMVLGILVGYLLFRGHLWLGLGFRWACIGASYAALLHLSQSGHRTRIPWRCPICLAYNEPHVLVCDCRTPLPAAASLIDTPAQLEATKQAWAARTSIALSILQVVLLVARFL